MDKQPLRDAAASAAAAREYAQAARAAAASVLMNIAPEYDETDSYEEGEYCVHHGIMYVANQPIGQAEPWNAERWTQTTLLDMVMAAIAAAI